MNWRRQTNVITSRLTTVIYIHITFEWLLLHVTRLLPILLLYIISIIWCFCCLFLLWLIICCQTHCELEKENKGLTHKSRSINKVERATEHERRNKKSKQKCRIGIYQICKKACQTKTKLNRATHKCEMKQQQQEWRVRIHAVVTAQTSKETTKHGLKGEQQQQQQRELKYWNREWIHINSYNKLSVFTAN